jgi:pimeloyl-ACP methyl ester carboxylesterase
MTGLVLTSSVFPWTRGGWPHPIVLGAFALYDVPGLGDRIVQERMRRLAPDRAVRLAMRLIAADPRRIPQDIVELNVELLRERRLDPEASRAFVEAARSLLRLGRRPAVARRALDAVKCPVLVLHGRRDRFVPAAFAEAMLRRYPQWRGRIFPDLGHAPMMEAPGRWLSEVADWFPGAVR